jgi:hypothetical protein
MSLTPNSVPMDDIEAVKKIVETVKDLKKEDQERVFRWAAEKLGLINHLASPPTPPPPLPPAQPGTGTHHHAPASTLGGMNIKAFIAEKRPRSDVQYAAAVAYYYRFEASQAEKKDQINSEDLQESTRKAGRERFGNPLQTLGNAHKLGLLDRGADRGTFVINSVGENLVAMTLPDGEAVKKPAKKRASRKS